MIYLFAEFTQTFLSLALLLGIVFLVFVSFYWTKKRMILRKLKKFKRRKIARFQSGERTKITGKVLHVHEPFVAPFSKRKCVAYVFKIEQKRTAGENSRWRAIVNQENIQDFFLKKDGEVIMVKAQRQPKQNYEFFLVEDRSASSGFMNDPTPEFETLLRHHGISSTDLFGFNKKLRYSERIIEVGEEITVGGIAKWKSIDEPIAGYSYSRIAVLESSDQQKLIITDHPDAAIVDRKV